MLSGGDSDPLRGTGMKLRELREYLGDERVAPPLGAISLWTLIFCGAFRHLL